MFFPPILIRGMGRRRERVTNVYVYRELINGKSESGECHVLWNELWLFEESMLLIV